MQIKLLAARRDFYGLVIEARANRSTEPDAPAGELLANGMGVFPLSARDPRCGIPARHVDARHEVHRKIYAAHSRRARDRPARGDDLLKIAYRSFNAAVR